MEKLKLCLLDQNFLNIAIINVFFFLIVIQDKYSIENQMSMNFQQILLIILENAKIDI